VVTHVVHTNNILKNNSDNTKSLGNASQMHQAKVYAISYATNGLTLDNASDYRTSNPSPLAWCIVKRDRN